MFSDETDNFIFHESSSFNHLPFLFNPPISNNTTTMAPNSSLEAIITQENTFNFTLTTPQKPPSKKDRHTKICTAQGLRDRRVRLSINIAREFFNLQDLLGFDKASKTLGWLLSKSKSAIDELAKSSSSKNKSIDWILNNGSEVIIAQEDEGGNKMKETEIKKGENVRRAKARERARERTKNKKKMMIMIRDRDGESNQHWCSGAPPNNYNQNNTSSCFGMSMCSQQGMNKTNKFKRSSYNYHCDQLCSRLDDDHHHQEGFNNDYLMKLALESSNGGINIHPPGFSAFNIINLSTEIHINGKPWDNRGNQMHQ